MTPTLRHCYTVLARAARPRDRLTVSDWADRYRWLSSKQSGERGRWRTARNPILGEIMDSLSVSSPVREIVVMKSSQVGVTEASVNWLGYILDHAPAPAMVLMPTLEARDTWKVQKLNPLLQETERVRDILGGLRSRDAANSKDAIDFPGGILFLAGGNSPNSYAQKSARYVMLDDLDRFPGEVGKEGDAVMLARGRCKSFPRYKLLLVSTPTVKDASLIEREYQASDRRRYHVHCPACGAAQTLRWPNLRWLPDFTHVWYECEACGQHIEEHHKPGLLAGGRWIAEDLDCPRRGYHISALYAPIGLGPTWTDLAREFVVAKDGPATLKTFVNTHLGETWEDRTTALKSNDLARRAEDRDMLVIPPGCLALTCGIDTQDKWLAVQLIGWGRIDGQDHLWILDWHELPGDTTQMQVWDELEAYLKVQHRNAHGRPLRIRAVAIDSRGHRGEQVRAFVQRPLGISVYAVQGATTRMGRAIAQTPSYPDKDWKGRAIKSGVGIWNIGTEHAKDYLYGHLAADGEKPEAERLIRFPSGLPVEYFDGLLSEVYDPESRRYVQRNGARYKRNEPLDTLVYAWAIAQHPAVLLGRNRKGKPDPNYWERLAAVLESPGASAVAAEAPVHTSAPAPSSDPGHAPPDLTAQLAASRFAQMLKARRHGR